MTKDDMGKVTNLHWFMRRSQLTGEPTRAPRRLAPTRNGYLCFAASFAASRLMVVAQQLASGCFPTDSAHKKPVLAAIRPQVRIVPGLCIQVSFYTPG